MSAVDFTIYDPTSGEIIRRGSCPEKLLGKQVRAGESILVGEALCDLQHHIQHDAEGRKMVCKRTPEEVARRAPPGWVPPIKAEVAGLAAKGIHPALAARLAYRRRDLAAAAHQDGLKPAPRGP